MKPIIFVRTLTTAERQTLQAGLRSAAAFTVRRCQILLASAAGSSPAAIARNLHCTGATVRLVVHAFARDGLGCLHPKSCRPHSARPLLDQSFAAPLTELLHQSPRLFGQPTSLWSLDRVAQVVHGKGWSPRRLAGETIRQALKRLGIRWRRAKHWITSPDPAYARKKKPATA
jgi:hypothetical protein